MNQLQGSLFDEPHSFSLDDLFAELDKGDGSRWYQRECIDAIKAQHAEVRSTLIVMATGLGKTFCFSRYAHEWDQGPVLVLAHRDELIQQAQASLSRMVGDFVDVEQADNQASFRARYVVGSVQSMMQKKRLERMGHDRFGLVIIDECFPSDTRIETPWGIRPIGSLIVGAEVLAVDHETGLVQPRRVMHVFKKRSSSMWRLCYGAAEVTCTKNHPFFVRGRGYVEAAQVRPGDLLCVRTAVHLRDQVDESGAPDMLDRVSRAQLIGAYGAHESQTRFGANEAQQPHGAPGVQGEGNGDAQGDGTQAEGSWGQRQGGDPGGVGDSGGAWVGASGANPDEDASGFRLPDLLQGRRGQSGPSGGDRGGRGEPFSTGQEGSGPEEGGLLTWVRVDSSEGVEPTSPGGDDVYNLEVEGSHTYFANGALVHNCHHATAASYRKVMDWFGPAKILGVTATPDRGDEKALGQCFDSVSYVYDIEQGIDDGYLVPLLGKHVDVKEVDVSKVKTSKGDLAEGELDELMMQACAGIVSGVLEHAPERKAIAFMPGIRSAALLMETFNEKQPGSTCYIDGKTPKDERREIIRDFNAGRYLRLANCGIATEGFDSPGVNLVIHGRPTKSRALYAQMTGRGTRVLPGLVDGIRHREGADQRRALVAGSAKPNCLLLDFVANSGKHDLVTPEDLLGGNYDEEEVKLAKKKAKEGGGGDVREELEKARQELKRLAAAAQAAKVKAEVRDFDPFRAFGVDISEARRYDRYGKPMPGWVRESLERKGVSAEELGRLSGRAAFKLHDELKRRHKADLCTLKQSRILTKYGVDPAKLSFARATEAIDYLASVKWRPDASKLHDIVTRQRQPGEE